MSVWISQIKKVLQYFKDIIAIITAPLLIKETLSSKQKKGIIQYKNCNLDDNCLIWQTQTNLISHWISFSWILLILTTIIIVNKYFKW